MKKIRVLLGLLALMFVVILTSCGSKPTIEGTWRHVDFEVIETNRSSDIANLEVQYIIQEFTVTETQITHDGHVAIYELSEDESHLVISSGTLRGSNSLELEGDVLYFNHQMYYRVDSDVYAEHRIEVEADAEEELARLVFYSGELARLSNEYEVLLDELDNAVLQAEETAREHILLLFIGEWKEEIDSEVTTLIIDEDGRFESETIDTERGGVDFFSGQLELRHFSISITSIDRAKARKLLSELKDDLFTGENLSDRIEEVENELTLIQQEIDRLGNSSSMELLEVDGNGFLENGNFTINYWNNGYIERLPVSDVLRIEWRSMWYEGTSIMERQ